AARGPGRPGARLCALRRRVVRLPDAPHGRAPVQPALLPARSRHQGLSVSRIAILGAGVMGGALLSALLRSGQPAEDIVISERMGLAARETAEQYAVRSAPVAEAVAGADIVVLAVKPQDMSGLLRSEEHTSALQS